MRFILSLLLLWPIAVHGANGLLDDLVAYYNFNEASATDNFADSHSGVKTLTQSGSPAVVTGKLNGGRGFVTSDRGFRSDEAFDFPGDFSLCFWWKVNGIDSVMAFVSHDNTTAGNRGWGVNMSSVEVFSVYGSVNGTDVTIVAVGDITATVGVRYFFAVRRSGNTLSISVTPDSEGTMRAFTDGSLTGTMNAPAVPFVVGARCGSSTPTFANHANGEMDELALWSVALDTADFEAIYNSGGTPLGFPDYDATPTDTITATSPPARRIFQRDGSSYADIPVAGSYTGTITGIEARFNGGAWAVVDAAPAAGSFSGTLPRQVAGNGTLEFRAANDNLVTTSVLNVGIGDIFVCAGQSNMSGRGTESQSYSHGSLIASLFGNDYAWKNLADSYDSAAGQVDAVSSDSGLAAGSVAPLIATALLPALGVPIAFIPCAKGGTEISDHLPGADHQDRATLYGSMVYRALQVGGVKAVLWWQGETDAFNSIAEATYNSSLDTIANAVRTDLGVKLIPVKLQACGDRDVANVNAAIGDAWDDNVNIGRGPDFFGSVAVGGDNVHVSDTAQLQIAADLYSEAILRALYPPPYIRSTGFFAP